MPESSRWFIIVNPVSGGGRALRRWPLLCAALTRHGVQYESATTAQAGHALDLARLAIARGHRRLLALGGDGSFNELVNGLLAQRAVPLESLLAGVAPLGTGNDWARAMQVPDDPDRLAEAMARGRSRRVDLGVAEVPGVAGGASRRLAFHNNAGAGINAEALRLTLRGGPRALAYLIGLARALMRYKAPQFEVTADGRLQSGRYLVALAAVGHFYGAGMRLAPGAQVDDGLFDLVLIDALTITGALRRLPKLFNGRLTADPAVHTLRCRSVTIYARPACGVEIDGQDFGSTPVQLTLQPGALTVLDCRDSAE
ncbi:MAG: diacylglycerol kinase family protein [Steroidobacteraceae bacterium]